MSDIRPVIVNTNVRLNLGEDEGPWAGIVVPVLLSWPDGEDVDSFHERAKALAVESLRPFLNNRTHLVADIWLPIEPATERDSAPARDDHREPANTVPSGG